MTKEDLFPLMLFGTAMMFMLTAIIVAMILISKQRIKELKLQQQQATLEHERELLRSRLQIQEEVLDWLSRELHDNIGQLLKLTQTQLSYLRENTSFRHHVLLEVEQSVQRCLNGVRDLAHKANGERIKEMGLVKAIKKELAYLHTLKEVSCNFKYPPSFPHFEKEKELHIFRIIQEAISNILYHAAAEKVNICINYINERLSLKIKDNGTGWPGEQQPVEKGLGLADMKKRAELLKGVLQIDTRPQKGTCITLIIQKIRPLVAMDGL